MEVDQGVKLILVDVPSIPQAKNGMKSTDKVESIFGLFVLGDIGEWTYPVQISVAFEHKTLTSQWLEKGRASEVDWRHWPIGFSTFPVKIVGDSSVILVTSKANSRVLDCKI